MTNKKRCDYKFHTLTNTCCDGGRLIVMLVGRTNRVEWTTNPCVEFFYVSSRSKRPHKARNLWRCTLYMITSRVNGLGWRSIVEWKVSFWTKWYHFVVILSPISLHPSCISFSLLFKLINNSFEIQFNSFWGLTFLAIYLYSFFFTVDIKKIELGCMSSVLSPHTSYKKERKRGASWNTYFLTSQSTTKNIL